MRKGMLRVLIVSGTAFLAAAPVAVPKGGQPLALASLQPGLWEVRELDIPQAAPRTMCISDINRLLQIQHFDALCSRLIVANGLKSVTATYNCSAQNYGRTHIRVETPRLAIIDTQGIDGNAPFAYRAELRWKSGCAHRDNR